MSDVDREEAKRERRAVDSLLRGGERVAKGRQRDDDDDS
jgi:hypothetical protein